MQTVSICASAIMTVAITAPASGAYAQDSKLSVPDVTVTALAGPFEPPYMRNPGKAYARNPYFGRYRVEEDQFPQVPCSQTRIAFSPGGNCLQGYRLTPAPFNSWNGSSTCDMALDVVIDTSGKLSIEADILVFDPYKVVANGGANPRFCYVNSYLGYDEEDFLDMNQVTRRGTNWHNLVVNDSQNQWYGGDRLRSIQFSDGLHNCIAVRKPGPVWRGGYVYMMRASICRTDTAAVQAQDIAYVLSSLQTRIYDGAGNLRKAGDQTTYGSVTNSR